MSESNRSMMTRRENEARLHNGNFTRQEKIDGDHTYA